MRSGSTLDYHFSSRGQSFLAFVEEGPGVGGALGSEGVLDPGKIAVGRPN
jgi:hypothetical protein